MAPTALAVNHLLFVDDSMLLFKANDEGTHALSNLLHVYCGASGSE